MSEQFNETVEDSLTENCTLTKLGLCSDSRIYNNARKADSIFLFLLALLDIAIFMNGSVYGIVTRWHVIPSSLAYNVVRQSKQNLNEVK